MPSSSPSPPPTAPGRAPDPTCHGAQDTEAQPPPDQPSSPAGPAKRLYGLHDATPSATAMHRQDSGYESTSPGDPQHVSRSGRRHTGSTTSSRTGSRTRPPTRRAAKSGPVTRLPKTSKLGSRSLMLTQSNPAPTVPPLYNYHDTSPFAPRSSTQTAYFHFPSPDPHPNGTDAHPDANDSAEEPAPYEAPPPTTHYWTSDRTRRLEYAAIDAASRGFKGWFMRHLVPDCFVPKAKRRITFDDDSGSVRRYRLELESEESAQKHDPSADIVGGGVKRRRSFSWWRRPGQKARETTSR